MKRQSIYLVFLTLALCSIALFVIFVGWDFLQSGEKPTVRIISPDEVSLFNSGDGIAVAVSAESNTGLARIVLLVDGEVYAEQSAANELSFTEVFPWYATSLGKHTIQVIAYDKLNRASDPSMVMVGVRSSLEPAGMDYVYIPPNESAGETGSGQIVPAAGGEGSGQPDGGELPQPQQNPPEEILGEPILPEDVEALPNAADNPPQILAFQASPNRRGFGVELVYHIEAQDDLGIDRLELSAQSETGGQSWAVQCFGEASCLADGAFQSGTGIWLMSVHAIDTSGQSSEPNIVAVEIVGGGFNPAVAILDAVAARPLIADALNPPQVGIPIDFNRVDPNIVIDNAVIVESDCMQALVEPRSGGHFISAVYLCDEEAPPGYILHWRIEANASYGGGNSTEVLNRTYEDRTTLGPGDNFSALYETPLCGTSSNYRIFLYWRSGSSNYGGWTLDMREVPGPDCGADTLIRDLQALPAADGTDITWIFAQSNDFSSGVGFSLYRYSPIGAMFFQPDSRSNLYHGSVTAEQLVQGETTQTFKDTDAQCGFMPYYYTLEWKRPEQASDFRTAVLERLPCPQGSIGNIQLQLNAGYTMVADDRLPYYLSAISAHSVIPPGFPFPQAENLVLRLNVRPVGFFGQEQQVQPLPGNVMEIPITNDVRANGFVFDSTAQAKCSGTHHKWEYAWELLSNGQPIETGPAYPVNSPPCLPDSENAPAFTSIHGSSDPAICNGHPYCVVIEWGAIPLPQEYIPPETQHSVDGLGLFRSLSSSEGLEGEPSPNQFWTTSLEQFTFVDTSIGCTSREGNFSYRYEIYPMAQGVSRGSRGHNTAFIDSPACGQPYNIPGTILQ